MSADTGTERSDSPEPGPGERSAGSGEWFASCARGLAPLLLEELQDLGAAACREVPAGVAFSGARAVMYRACLWSRLASRVLMPLGQGAAQDANALHRTVHDLSWETLLADGASIAVDFHGTNGEIRDTRFGAQRVKDGIVDRLRAAGRERPRVDRARPDLRISVRLRGDVAEVALDLVGGSLHRRGYRSAAGAAPLKETLAAALLLRAGWPAMAARGGALVDPLCGSGTLLIEGAFMAADRAPALNREHFGFAGWREHDEAQWQALRSDARGRFRRALDAGLPEIRGYDGDPRVIRRAQENIAQAELSKFVRVSVKRLGEVKKPTHKPLPEGLVICNPPYGERLGDRDSLPLLYRSLGELLHGEFQGWDAAVLAPDKVLGKAIGLRSHRQYAFENGPIPVQLLLIALRDNALADEVPAPPSIPSSGGVGDSGGKKVGEGVGEGAGDGAGEDAGEATGQGARGRAGERAGDGTGEGSAGNRGEPAALSDGAKMFANRLLKNQRRLKRWLAQSGVTCYRLYDADMPEYAVAVDRYEGWLHVAEYRAPASVDRDAAAARFADVQAALPSATGVPPERIVYKTRERQRGAAQYSQRDARREMLRVKEGPAKLLVNLHDYLDTGLFLDSRPLRLRIAGECRGKRFLNLFCYTGTATVHAALGGASHCTSVDLSNTYLRWLRKNLALNGLPEARHRFERADCLQWLKRGSETFDLILLDPPSFSNSSAMAESFDVQRDHGALIAAAMARLAPGGSLYFCTNRRRFRLDDGVAGAFSVADITAQTLDPDFHRDPPPHRVWLLQHAA